VRVINDECDPIFDLITKELLHRLVCVLDSNGRKFCELIPILRKIYIEMVGLDIFPFVEFVLDLVLSIRRVLRTEGYERAGQHDAENKGE
jgi:hypothetical protein